MKTEIYYSVQNCGDGSAYPDFYDSEELAYFDQDHMDEGWGEACVGSLTIEHDGPIKIKELKTVKDYYNDRDNWPNGAKEEFIEQFFEGLEP